jgi:transcription elongation factor Elf1
VLDERADRTRPPAQDFAFRCPVCKGQSYSEVPLAGSASFTIRLYRCGSCTLTFVDPQRFEQPKS